MPDSDSEQSEDPIQEAILWAPDRECIDKVYDRRNGLERDVSPEEWAQFLQYAANRGVCLRLNDSRFMHYDGRYYRLDGDSHARQVDGVARVDAVSVLQGAESVEAVLVEDTPFADDDPEVRTDGGVDQPENDRLGWICTRCQKIVSTRPFGTCSDCGGEFRPANEEDRACDRCQDAIGKRLLDRTGEFDRLCESCIEALGLREDDGLRADGGYETVTISDEFVLGNVAPSQEARFWSFVETDDGEDYWVPTRLDPGDVEDRDAVPDPDVLPGDAVLQYPLESRGPELASGAMPPENVRNRVVE